MTFTAENINDQICDLVTEEIRSVRGGGSVKGRLRTVARLLGLSVDRVRRYHYGEVRRIEAHEAFQIIRRSQAARRQRALHHLAEYQRLQREVAAEAPPGLAFLVPPAVAPLVDSGNGPAAENDFT